MFFQGKSTAMCYWKQPETQFPSAIQQQDSSHQHRAKRMPKLNQRKESYWQPPPGLASSGDFKYKHCLKLRLISLQMLKETQLTDTLLRPTSSLSSQQELSPKDNIWRTHPRNARMAPSPWAVSLELCPQPTELQSNYLGILQNQNQTELLQGHEFQGWAICMERYITQILPGAAVFRSWERLFIECHLIASSHENKTLSK